MGCSNSNPSNPNASNDGSAKLSPPTSPQLGPSSWSPTKSSSNASSPFQARGIASSPGSLHAVYDVEEAKLGEGRFGMVTRGKHKDKQTYVAIKAIPTKTAGDVDAISGEMDIMNKVNHMAIVKLYESFQDSFSVFLVMELCNGGTLLERVLEVGRFSEFHAAKVLLQILPALQHLHENRICHRDIKPENFMFVDWDPIDQGFLKMIDFGSATFVRHGEYLSTMVGTPTYVAPEVLQGKYNETCDLWSTGVILFVLLSGIPPFKGTDEEVLQQARLGNISLNTPQWSNISEDAKDMVRELCQMRFSDRPSADEAFRHEWIKDMAPKASDRKLEGTYQNLKGFSGHGKVKKLAHYALARRLTMEDLTDMRNEFEIIDRNKDGTVTFHEFKAMLDKRDEKSAEEMRRVFEAVDLDGNKRIEYTEFLAAALDKRQSAEEHSCWMAFNVFDHDGSGMISKKELKDILENEEKCLEMTSTFGTTIDSQSIARCLAECDADEDGQIDFQEFLDVMRGGQPYVPESPQPRRVNINRFT